MEPAFQSVMNVSHTQKAKKEPQKRPISRDEPSKFVQRGANQNPEKYESHTAPAHRQTDALAFLEKAGSSFTAASDHAVAFVPFVIHDADQ